jgi:hypothetical protein
VACILYLRAFQRGGTSKADSHSALSLKIFEVVENQYHGSGSGILHSRYRNLLYPVLCCGRSPGPLQLAEGSRPSLSHQIRKFSISKDQSRRQRLSWKVYCWIFNTSYIMAALNSGSSWTPDSWRTKPIKQSPGYPDEAKLAKSLEELKRLPPIVHPREISVLKQSLRDVARGEAFLLLGGDCAELFDYCEQNAIESKIKLLLQMSLVLIWGADKKVVRIGRMAGQYAKPRSSPTEVVNGKEIPSFRGDILNGYQVEDRDIDPTRLVR